MIFEILFSVFLVHLSISLSTESSITCLNKEKFSTPSGDLDCQLSCQCPSDDQKEVRSVYVGCEKCCCVDMNYKRIEKALQETTEKNKVSALIIAICLASFVLLVIIGATIFIFLFKNWLKQFDIPCFHTSNVTTDCEGRRESKAVTVENIAFFINETNL
ncbi:uncharacterized protein LOC101235027 isoform X3 [Hydra vulgaris]|uniref:uncharacterized protein LOC101235027 isoform X3 n=1 Tax=Hydra vulgaris TaxID=6087 RepID=UPI00064174AE|nr:uncharacterized protein LOC101235027 isoform X3 [Hydra vulgaris]